MKLLVVGWGFHDRTRFYQQLEIINQKNPIEAIVTRQHSGIITLIREYCTNRRTSRWEFPDYGSVLLTNQKMLEIASPDAFTIFKGEGLGEANIIKQCRLFNIPQKG